MANSGSDPTAFRLDIRQILLEAQNRWLRPAEICEILQNYPKFHITPEPPYKPVSGSVLLFDRKVLTYFRKDGHNWRKKKDGKTVKEAYEKLKVGSIDVLHCCYANGEENDNFQRRSYWMLEQDLMHIVFVHYLEVKGNKTNISYTRSSEPAQSNSLDESSSWDGFPRSQNLTSASPTSTLTLAHDKAESVECFLRPNKMVNRDPQTFLNMLLSTMKEKLPDVTVASGQELGQRMVVEVVKVSASDELDSFEIGQPLPSVQSLLNGGETTEIDSLNQQSNLQNMENNVTAEQLVPYYSFEIGQLLPSFQSLHDGGKTIEIDPSHHQPNLQNGESNIATAPVVPSCSSHKRDAFNNKELVEVDLSPQHPTEDAVTNRRRAGVDVAHDYTEIEKDTSEMMQPGLHIELPNVEIDSRGKARINDKLEHKEKIIQRIVKDHGITREILEQHFGMERKDAAKALHVSVSTLKRMCREYDISRWPHHKSRKVNHHATKAAALQGVEPYMEDQERPNLSQENGTDCLAHKRSPATSKPCDTVMTLKVKYRDHTIKFKLTPESTRVELQREVEKRLKISLENFSIKYQDEDDEWITIATDSDLKDGMEELRSLKRTPMRLLVTPNPDA